MPPYAKSRTRIDADQMIIIESMIAEYSLFLARDESDIDENDITFQPLTNDVNSTEINDIWNEHEHTLNMNSSPRRNRIRLQEHQTITTNLNTTPETIRNTQSIQDTNISYNGCIFSKKRNQQKSKVVLRLFIYALIYCTAGFLEYFGIGTNPKRRISKTSWSQRCKV